jgi:hypothetical protein
VKAQHGLMLPLSAVLEDLHFKTECLAGLIALGKYGAAWRLPTPPPLPCDYRVIDLREEAAAVSDVAEGRCVDISVATASTPCSATLGTEHGNGTRLACLTSS